MKKTPKKLVLAKETVQDLGLQEVKGGGTCSSFSAQMRNCDSWWYCGASQDTYC